MSNSDTKTDHQIPPEAVVEDNVIKTSSSEENEVKTLPKIRIKMEEEAVKVKKFATAQGLSMHLKLNKVKKVGFTTLHKVATWLTPKK